MIELKDAPANIMGLLDYIKCIHCGVQIGYSFSTPLVCPECGKSVPFGRSLINNRELRIKYHREGTIYNAKVHN
jgi:predicted RNA-binding Zn-ribbon protein involved in translation (DUF1610 family)